MNSIGSKCEWKLSTTVRGTFRRCSVKDKKNYVINCKFSFILRFTIPIMKPMVTSSGNLILSPMLINLPPPAIGNIFNVKARLKQKPAPPVANQNVIFLFNEVFFCNEKKEENIE